MLNRKCTIPHNPPFSYGDCIRACISTLTDDDEVPHVFNGNDSRESWKLLREYLLSKHGKYLALFAVDGPDEMEENNPDIPYMLLCATTAGDHAMVWKGSRILNDPAAFPLPITGPCSAGYWIVGVLV